MWVVSRPTLVTVHLHCLFLLEDSRQILIRNGSQEFFSLSNREPAAKWWIWGYWAKEIRNPETDSYQWQFSYFTFTDNIFIQHQSTCKQKMYVCKLEFLRRCIHLFWYMYVYWALGSMHMNSGNVNFTRSLKLDVFNILITRPRLLRANEDNTNPWDGDFTIGCQCASIFPLIICFIAIMCTYFAEQMKCMFPCAACTCTRFIDWRFPVTACSTWVVSYWQQTVSQAKPLNLTQDF